MKLIQVVPDELYFIWQLYVQMLNFREYGIEREAVILVAANGAPSEAMKKFEAFTNAKVFYYPDTRESAFYIPSIRPHLIKKYLSQYPTHVFFYHDQDIIFRKKPELDKLAAGPMNYVAKSAEGYLRAKSYLDGFKKDGHDHVGDMARIIGLDPELIRSKDDLEAVGGAQYVIKGTNSAFWDKVEKECEMIFRDLEARTAGQEYHIQVWATDMWVLLYNLWRIGDTRHAPEIDFCWPWDNRWPVDNQTAADQPIMHNAGIHPGNKRYDQEKKGYLKKEEYKGGFPFDEDHSYIEQHKVQFEYVSYFSKVKKVMDVPKKRKIIAAFCTHNKINPKLLSTALAHLKKAADATTSAEVEVVTCSWEPIPDNPFEHQLLTPFRDMDWLNYVLQLLEITSTREGDIVTVHEHDMIYPEDYFEQVMANFDYTKYGLWNENYIGVNETGFLKVNERHHPFSTLACAKGYFERTLQQKVREIAKSIHVPPYPGWEPKYGVTNVEPDNKSDFKMLPFTNVRPCVHVNMNNTQELHHLSGHYMIYEKESSMGQEHPDWGNFKQYFPL